MVDAVAAEVHSPAALFSTPTARLRKSLAHLTALTAFLLALAGCGEGESTPTRKGDLRVQPPGSEELSREVSWDFGAIAAGTTARVSFLLVNVGEDPARISEVRFEDAVTGAFFVQAPGQIDAGAREPLQVTFSPPAAGAFEATLVVVNDGTGGDAVVRLRGEGK